METKPDQQHLRSFGEITACYSELNFNFLVQLLMTYDELWRLSSMSILFEFDFDFDFKLSVQNLFQYSTSGTKEYYFNHDLTPCHKTYNWSKAAQFDLN